MNLLLYFAYSENVLEFSNIYKDEIKISSFVMGSRIVVFKINYSEICNLVPKRL